MITVTTELAAVVTELNVTKDGAEIGSRTDASWLTDAPFGLRALLQRLRDVYGDQEFWLLENGMPVIGEGSMTAAQAYNDDARISYYKGHLDAAAQAVREDGIRLALYTAWSLLDNFEWAEGYSQHFGVVFNDYATQQRTPKKSFKWLGRQLGLRASGAVHRLHGQCGGTSGCPHPGRCRDAPWPWTYCGGEAQYCCRVDSTMWQCHAISSIPGFGQEAAGQHVTCPSGGQPAALPAVAASGSGFFAQADAA